MDLKLKSNQMNNYTDKLINSQNKELWENIDKDFQITLTKSHEPNYLINFKNDKITIYVDEHDLRPSSFTHELLHIEMKRNEKNIGKHLDLLIQENDQLHYLFSLPLRDHIGNCLEHVKMLPKFLELGFSNSEFISDFVTKKMTNTEWSNIKSAYLNNKIFDKQAVDFLIGKFFGMKACNNKKHNYSKYYSGIAKLDRKLSKAINEFWNDWLTFNPSDQSDDYSEMIELFIADLNDWQNGKTII